MIALWKLVSGTSRGARVRVMARMTAPTSGAGSVSRTVAVTNTGKPPVLLKPPAPP